MPLKSQGKTPPPFFDLVCVCVFVYICELVAFKLIHGLERRSLPHFSSP